jgi:hypothetical protein
VKLYAKLFLERLFDIQDVLADIKDPEASIKDRIINAILGKRPPSETPPVQSAG